MTRTVISHENRKPIISSILLISIPSCQGSFLHPTDNYWKNSRCENKSPLQEIIQEVLAGEFLLSVLSFLIHNFANWI
jgi:hypothetical protein